MLTKEIIKQLKKIEATQKQIAKLRDKLREEVSDLEGLLESLDRGVYDFDVGLRNMQSGLDHFSEYL